MVVGSEGTAVQVTTQHLNDHATAVDGFVADVNEAGSAAQQVHLDTRAYGLFCQALPAMMSPLQETIIGGIAGSSANLADVADKLRFAAQNYDQSDAAASTRMGGRS